MGNTSLQTGPDVYSVTASRKGVEMEFQARCPRKASSHGSSIYTTILKRALLIAACLYVAPAAQGAEGIHKIEHVVTIMQENRSFDQYFGTYPGATGIPAGVCVPDPVNGGCQRPFHNARDNNQGGPHGNAAAVADIHGGAMDGFVASVEHVK